MAINVEESTEDGDEANVHMTGGTCYHVPKAVDLPKVKRALKGTGLRQDCPECRKSPPHLAEDTAAPELRGLWLCLRCGHQGCGRTCQKHALLHSQVPHSDCHALAVNTVIWNIWCYECDMEIAVDCRKKLHECIKFLKQQDCPARKPGRAVRKEDNDEVSRIDEASKPVEFISPTIRAGSSKKRRPVVQSVSLPRVRGLRNVGNTCYFNAVLQNLAQTPFLLEVLKEMKDQGSPFRLPGDGNELPALEGELGKWGAFTETFACTLEELRTGTAEVLNPDKLLNKLVQKHPQFRLGDQHDSHELLRQLLEEARNEDLKRYQTEILHKVGLRKSVDPSVVPDLLKSVIKSYGRQASELILCPEQPFRGELVSTLECQDCKHSSQRMETFLELSLPVVANKPQPPAVARRKTSNEDTFDLSGNPSKEQMSKHQMKKERKQAKKGKRKRKGRSVERRKSDPVTTEEAAGNVNSRESEETDADIEDNIEQELHLSHQGKDIAESGYSSEKAMNEDSTVNSPTCPPLNVDSVLASPDDEDLQMRDSDPLMMQVDDNHLAPAWEQKKDQVVGSNSELTVNVTSFRSPQCGLGSRLSTPSPVSSEVNVECASPAPTEVIGGCTSPISDSERPISRFTFWQDEHSASMDCCNTLEGTPSSNFQEETSEKVSNAINELREDFEKLHVVESPSSQNKNVTTVNADSPPGALGSVTNICDMECDISSGSKSVPSVNTNVPIADLDKNVAMSPRYTCTNDECSLQSCLNQFSVLELMTGNNKVVCENCSEYYNKGKGGKMICTNSTKQYLVSSPPAVLVLHLKRFDVNQSMSRKISRHVSFPMLLDLAPICSTKCRELPTMRPDQKQVLYALYGIVEHEGTMHGGHYVAYVKVRPPLKDDDPRWAFLPASGKQPIVEEGAAAVGGTVEPPAGKWYHVSDSRVVEVQEERVLKSKAYLLFYERIW